MLSRNLTEGLTDHLICLGNHQPQDLYLECDGLRRHSITGKARLTCHLSHHLLHHPRRRLWFHLNRRFHRLHCRRHLQPFRHRQQQRRHLYQRRRALEQEMEPVLESVLE